MKLSVNNPLRMNYIDLLGHFARDHRGNIFNGILDLIQIILPETTGEIIFNGILDLISGYFARDYGGNIFNGISSQGILYHAFRLYDTNADVIAAIDLNKKTITFSELTNLRGVHNLALVSP